MNYWDLSSALACNHWVFRVIIFDSWWELRGLYNHIKIKTNNHAAVKSDGLMSYLSVWLTFGAILRCSPLAMLLLLQFLGCCLVSQQLHVILNSCLVCLQLTILRNQNYSSDCWIHWGLTGELSFTSSPTTIQFKKTTAEKKVLLRNIFVSAEGCLWHLWSRWTEAQGEQLCGVSHTLLWGLSTSNSARSCALALWLTQMIQFNKELMTGTKTIHISLLMY